MKEMMVVCGDSYNAGIGCVNMHTQAYGVVTAQHFDWDLITLARGSASNYAVHLQAMYAAELLPHLVIIGQTSYDRLEWVMDTHSKPAHEQPTLHNLNYHLYPPHHFPQPHHDKPMPFHLQDSADYKPYLLTEQVGGIDDYLTRFKKNPGFPYYERLHTEPREKLELIRDYYVNCVDYAIKRDYDIGLLLQAYTFLKRKGINCLILTRDIGLFGKFIDQADLMHQDWWYLSNIYPDTIGSMHTSEIGHQDTADRLIAKIKENNLA